MIHRLDFERLSLHFVVITTTKVTVKFVLSVLLYVIVVSKANDYVFHLGPDPIYSVKNKEDGGDWRQSWVELSESGQIGNL